MSLIEVDTAVKKVGNSLAVFIPADKARAGGLREGALVHVVLDAAPKTMLGLLKGTAYEPFDRRKDGMWHDRI